MYLKVLVTGVKGQLGFDVMKALNHRNIEAIGADIQQFDITDYDQTRKFIKDLLPDAVIHCSAYTAVDKAEDEPEICYKVNAEGTKNIALVCKEIDAKMVYISTDYVFPGIGEKEYNVDDQTDPLGVYGKTKLQGEQFVKQNLQKFFIVRISWVFGKNGNNFVKTMLRLGKEKEELNVVIDQIGSPTYTVDVARLLCDMIVTEKYGTYHATNEGFCSWAEFAKEIFRQAGFSTKVNYIMSAEYKTKAARPHNSRMTKDKLDENGFERLSRWDNALKRYLVELGEI